jgi:hypothetical protein
MEYGQPSFTALTAAAARAAHLIVDYLLPVDLRDEAGAMYGSLVAQASAQRGEPWLSAFAPAELSGPARPAQPTRPPTPPDPQPHPAITARSEPAVLG